MKYKLLILLLPAAAATVLISILAGRALSEKEKPLPPTGANPVLSGPAAPPLRWDHLSVDDLETALEEQQDAEELLEFIRSRLEPEAQTPAPLPGLTPSGLSKPAGSLPSPPAVVPAASSPEPTLREVHLAAVRYAEVAPEKIRRWRWLAQLRNFVPRFSVDIDRDRSSTISSLSSKGERLFFVGPERRDTSIDFGFTWDLANFVWDPAQTSIDARSRLMVKLRNEILEEVTELYFERKRLRAEFEANPTDDPTIRRERRLRLEKLAGRLDALTDGLYSRNRNAQKADNSPSARLKK